MFSDAGGWMHFCLIGSAKEYKTEKQADSVLTVK